MTLSSTLSAGNGRTSWNVRAMPRRHTASGVAPGWSIDNTWSPVPAAMTTGLSMSGEALSFPNTVEFRKPLGGIGDDGLEKHSVRAPAHARHGFRLTLLAKRLTNPPKGDNLGP